MHLTSVQVGQPMTVGTSGSGDPMERVFTSAIWKRPVSGPVWAGALGLTGDAVANTRVHGGPDQALLMYAGAHYPVWEAEWGRDDLGPGAFGENLTVTGLTEPDVCIGDVLEIGEAMLQVTQPRQPCATLARRHGIRDLIAVVQRNGRSGWYLRVTREGALEAGQPIGLLDRPCPEWTVRRAALAMLRRKEHPEEARALGRCPALSRDWRERLGKL
ncbi:MAG TPA: MOSC domain-containing protein [Gemmatimonadales bacterium]|nr:MOSC domain-containing protein [Gemmatimonadales bacterium]